MQQTIRIVAAVLDTRQLTLYQENGSTISIQQGDPRLAEIVNTITPVLAAGPGSVAELPWGTVRDDSGDAYREYEKQAGGLVKLYRVAKSAISRLFGGTNHEQPTPSVTLPQQAVSAVPAKDPVAQTAAAVSEILAHAQPVSDPTFTEKGVGDAGDATIVAVVGNQMVEGVERLKPQIKRATEIGSTAAMNRFMERVAAVASKRRHSANDLLKFLEKGDLPIAEDGSIIIYKILRRHHTKSGYYVDCYTGLVPQRVGSFVVMDEALVDPDRYNECSNGLHVARRGYINTFSGDLVVLAKVAPEDVIAVPHKDANKMRVCGYHILFELPDTAYEKLKRGQPFTETEDMQALLARALRGDHPPRIEEVRIHGSRGTEVKVTALVPEAEVTEQASPEAPKETQKAQAAVSEPLPRATALELPSEEKKPALTAPIVSPKAVTAVVQAEKAAAESRVEKAGRLWKAFQQARSKKARQEAAQELLDHKKATKLGWLALKLPADAGEQLTAAVATPVK